MKKAAKQRQILKRMMATKTKCTVAERIRKIEEKVVKEVGSPKLHMGPREDNKEEEPKEMEQEGPSAARGRCEHRSSAQEVAIPDDCSQGAAAAVRHPNQQPNNNEKMQGAQLHMQQNKLPNQPKMHLQQNQPQSQIGFPNDKNERMTAAPGMATAQVLLMRLSQ